LAFDRPTLTTIVDRIVSDFETLIDGIGTLLRRSTLKVMAKVIAGAVHIMWGFLEYMAKQLFISTAEGDYLDKIAAEYGIARSAGDYAEGTVTATGTNGSVIPVGTELQSDSDVVYIVQDEATIAGGSASLNIKARDRGSDANELSGVTLTFVSPIVGVNTTATIGADGLVDGSDEETDDELRTRVLFKKRNAPHGGAEHDYIIWALEYPGVTRAWVFSLYNGAGTVGLAFVRDDDASIIPNETQRNEVKDYLYEHTDPVTGEIVGIPVTAYPGLIMIDLQPLTVNFSISIYPNTTAVQNAIQDELENLILNEGGPGETLYRSRITEAIGLAVGEEYHTLNSPLIDITASNTQLHVMGTITFADY